MVYWQNGGEPDAGFRIKRFIRSIVSGWVTTRVFSVRGVPCFLLLVSGKEKACYAGGVLINRILIENIRY